MNREDRKKSELKYLRPSSNFSSTNQQAQETQVSNVCHTIQAEKFDWDPLEPAYDQHGKLKKVTWNIKEV